MGPPTRSRREKLTPASDLRPLGALPPFPRRAVAKPSPRTLQVSLLLASSCRPARATYLAAGEGEKDPVEPRPEVSSALSWTCWAQIGGGLVLNAYEPDTALQKAFKCSSFTCSWIALNLDNYGKRWYVLGYMGVRVRGKKYPVFQRI